MRKVSIQHTDRVPEIGLFHKFGVAWEEVGTAAGMYSTAIVELPDGHILNVPVEKIIFIKEWPPISPK